MLVYKWFPLGQSVVSLYSGFSQQKNLHFFFLKSINRPMLIH